MSMSAELAKTGAVSAPAVVAVDEPGTSTHAYRWVVLAVAFAAFFITFLDRLAWASANLLASQSL